MKIEVTTTGTRATLDCGTVVLGQPHDSESYRETARRLGYGGDTVQMCCDHDTLHVILCDFFGLPSHSLYCGAGLPHDATRAVLEEDAVMAVQRWLRGNAVSIEAIVRGNLK